MSCPAYADQNHMHEALMHSRGQDGAVSDIAGQLAETYGLHRQRHLTMDGGGYQAEIDYTKISGLSKTPCIHFTAERHAQSSLSDNDNNANFNLQMDLMAAAGAMTAELKDVILEISAMGADLTTEQKADFVKAIFNTYQLQQANEGRIELSTAELEKLSLDTIEILDGLAKDMILPAEFKSLAVSIIRETALINDLDIVVSRLGRFEKETAPKSLLEQSVAGLTVTLLALLDQDDLDDQTREQVEDLLERLELAEDGEPLPRDIMKDIKSLSEGLQEKVALGLLSPEMVSLSDTLKKDVFKVAEANIVVKAEKFGITIAQVRAIEKTMDRLDEIAEALPDQEDTLKAEIAEAIIALDQEPTSVKALAKLEMITEKLNTPAIAKLSLVLPALLAVITPFKTESLFVQKIQADTISRQEGIPRESVREFSALYRGLDQAAQTLPKNQITIRTQIIEALKIFGSKPISIAAIARVQSVVAVVAPMVSASIQAMSVKGTTTTTSTIIAMSKKVTAIQARILETVHQVKAPMIQKAVQTFQALDNLRQAVINVTRPLFKPANDTLVDTVPKNTVAITIEKAMESINRAPDRVAAVTDAVLATVTGGVEKLAEKSKSIVVALDQAKSQVEEFTKEVVNTIAEKSGKPIAVVKEMVGGAVEAIRQAFKGNEPPAPQVTEGYVAPTVTAAQKSQSNDLFGGAEPEKKKGLFDSVKSKCETCTSAFCDACTGAALKVISKFTVNPLKSIFSGVAKVTGLTKTRSLGAPAPKQP